VSKLVTGLTLSLVLFAALSLSGAPKEAHAEALYFDVINQTPYVVYSAYASPSGSGYWTRDLMTNDILMPREYGTLVFDDGLDGCFYDLKFETDGGDAWLFGVDLCHISTVRIV
jgi:hypothetical protein